MDRWRGKVAVVTGASSGIGKAIALKLAQEGIKTVGLARRTDEMEKILKAQPQNFHYRTCDITDEKNFVETLHDIHKTIGPIHILVNNAGVLKFGMITEQSSSDWRKILDTNLLSLCVASKEVIGLMRKSNIAGQIINVNSIAGHCLPYLDPPSIGVYPASKHGVTAATEVLRQEMAHLDTNIKITSLSPGYVFTEMTQVHVPGDFLNNPKGLVSEDIADGVVYILSTPPNCVVKELTLKHIGEKF